MFPDHALATPAGALASGPVLCRSMDLLTGSLIAWRRVFANSTASAVDLVNADAFVTTPAALVRAKLPQPGHQTAVPEKSLGRIAIADLQRK